MKGYRNWALAVLFMAFSALETWLVLRPLDSADAFAQIGPALTGLATLVGAVAIGVAGVAAARGYKAKHVQE